MKMYTFLNDFTGLVRRSPVCTTASESFQTAMGHCLHAGVQGPQRGQSQDSLSHWCLFSRSSESFYHGGGDMDRQAASLNTKQSAGSLSERDPGLGISRQEWPSKSGRFISLPYLPSPSHLWHPGPCTLQEMLEYHWSFCSTECLLLNLIFILSFA